MEWSLFAGRFFSSRTRYLDINIRYWASLLIILGGLYVHFQQSAIKEVGVPVCISHSNPAAYTCGIYLSHLTLIKTPSGSDLRLTNASIKQKILATVNSISQKEAKKPAVLLANPLSFSIVLTNDSDFMPFPDFKKPAITIVPTSLRPAMKGKSTIGESCTARATIQRVRSMSEGNTIVTLNIHGAAKMTANEKAGNMLPACFNHCQT